MKIVKTLVLIGSFGFSLLGTPMLAQSTNSAPPVIVEKGKVPIPADIKALIAKFEAERGAYLTEQAALVAKLKLATTEAERQAIRQDLQDNRQDFLADLKEFRQDLKQDIQELKGQLNNPELLRLIEEVKKIVENHNHHGKT
jgi:Skp family chaperone for outer membrane proteins